MGLLVDWFWIVEWVSLGGWVGRLGGGIRGKGWFWDEIRRKVGNGKSTSFWEVCWVLDGVSLKDLCPRLYSLEVEKKCLVADRVSLSEENVKVCWKWRSNTFLWENELLDDILNLVHRYSYDKNRKDCWNWRLTADGEYSTQSGYEKLFGCQDSVPIRVRDWPKFVWNNCCPGDTSICLEGGTRSYPEFGELEKEEVDSS